MQTNYLNDGYIVHKNDGDGEIIHIPYNVNNVLITEDDIKKFLEQNNVKVDKINHLHYFHKAFTHKSYINKNIIPKEVLEATKKEMGNPENLLELQGESYERLEYFGDRVVKIVVSMYLFHRYPNEDEGFMTRLQTKIEDKKNLAAMSKEIGLSKYFIISKQIESLNGRNLEKIHEDVFEAFMGALFLSNGFEPCLLLLLNLLESLIDYSDKLYRDNNYKDILLRFHHKQKWKFPKYEMIHCEGPPHKRTYLMGVIKPTLDETNKNVSNEEKYISYGLGNSKKMGEQNAAKMSLIMHGLLKVDQYSMSDIYYPPWSKIDKYDGESLILNPKNSDNKSDNESDNESDNKSDNKSNNKLSEDDQKNVIEVENTDDDTDIEDLSEETDDDIEV